MNAMGLMAAAAGGATGAALRFMISALMGAQLMFPWATLMINIAGSFAIGVLWGAFNTAEWFQQWGRLFLVVGLLGGFTTFSAFSLETLNLFQAGRGVVAAIYVCASVLCCLVAVYFGERGGQALLAFTN